MEIGSYKLDSNLILAPMAGVTDRPFRLLCKQFGAAMTVSEMITSNPSLWRSRKTQLRLVHDDEPEPRAVQIAGAEPKMMAEAARFNVDRGAQIIDINMGCPAKKICSVMAGSALLQDETLVKEILSAVVASVYVPVILKIRTGWDREHKNAVRIAHIAEQEGIQALTIHGRTRACRFDGHAEHDTTAEVKSRATIPVIANGDINSPIHAKAILKKTAADGIMIGRAAQGNPWIFREIQHYLKTGERMSAPTLKETGRILIQHLQGLYEHYGEYSGVRIARKHIAWYCREREGTNILRAMVNKANNVMDQMTIIENYFFAQGELAA